MAANSPQSEERGEGFFLLHNADLVGREDRTTAEDCCSLDEAARLISARQPFNTVAYAWRREKQLVTIPAVDIHEMSNGAKWSTGSELIVFAKDTGHRSHGKILIALEDVDFCCGDGAVFPGVHSYDAALRTVIEKSDSDTAAYFLHTQTDRLIEKPKKCGSNWGHYAGSGNSGWLFLWADKYVGGSGSGGGLRKVEVGRVMSWYEYRTRAEQEGGRLPTTAELRAAGVDVGYDQWTPITFSEGDQQTGRCDGVNAANENAWANIGPRKYQAEFPVWGLDASTHPWKHLTYFYVAGGCGGKLPTVPAGLEDGRINDDQMTASSMYSGTCQPHFARLNCTRGEGWCADEQKKHDLQQWLQIDLGKDCMVAGVQTQGQNPGVEWVSRFDLQMSLDGNTFFSQGVFEANTGPNDIVTTLLPSAVSMRYVRFVVKAWGGPNPTLRAEVLLAADTECAQKPIFAPKARTHESANAAIPRTITVSNACTEHGHWPNDMWHLNGESCGKPQWCRQGNPRDYIQWDGHRWMLTGSQPKCYFQNVQDTPLPPQSGWQEAEMGVSSMPTLSYGSGGGAVEASLPSSSADASIPRTITVSNARTHEGHGHWPNDMWHLKGESCGKPQWCRQRNPHDYIHWDGRRWMLNGMHPKCYFQNVQDTPLPPQSGWQEAEMGVSSMPTLSYSSGGASQPASQPVGTCTLQGWAGYNERFNGPYDPIDRRVNERPVFRHTTHVGVGAGADWCRIWWAGGAWRIGHFMFLESDQMLCCAFVRSDAAHPSEIQSFATWFQHPGRQAGKDFSRDETQFSQHPGVMVRGSPAAPAVPRTAEAVAVEQRSITLKESARLSALAAPKARTHESANAAIPRTITVSNACTEHGHWPNDTWHLKGGSCGKPQWCRQGNPHDYIQWDGRRWMLNGSQPKCYFQNMQDTPLPPQSGWQEAEMGVSSMPTLSYSSGGGDVDTGGLSTSNLTGTYEASLFSPPSKYLSNDGSFDQSKRPSPWTIFAEGDLHSGCKVHLAAADGRFLRSDGREGTPPAWAKDHNETTMWLLLYSVGGRPTAETPVQFKSPTSGGGGGEPCLCNDTPTGGWGGTVRGMYSWCPEGRGDAFWTLHGLRSAGSSNGPLRIHEARYGWAGDLWSAALGSGAHHGGGAKDVTDLVRSMVINDELHINPSSAPMYMNLTFWAETAHDPPIPRKLAVRYSYGDGDAVTVETLAVPWETVALHVNRHM